MFQWCTCVSQQNSLTRGPHECAESWAAGSSVYTRHPTIFSPHVGLFYLTPHTPASAPAQAHPQPVVSFIFLPFLRWTAFLLYCFILLLYSFTLQRNCIMKCTTESTQFWLGLLKAVRVESWQSPSYPRNWRFSVLILQNASVSFNSWLYILLGVREKLAFLQLIWTVQVTVTL